MPTIQEETFINAPVERVFDAARDIGLHCRTSTHTQERAVAGRTSGLIDLGESVTFEGVHLGVRQLLTAQIVEFQAPHRFADEMTRGAFTSLRHIHKFAVQNGGTLMTDTLVWVAPFGILGCVADILLLKRHLRNFLRERNTRLKAILEAKTL